MSLAVRVIPCLDVDAGRVVKGINFQDLRDAGDPVELAKVYDAEGADELTFLDISASHEGRATTMEIVSATAEQVFIPLTVGGGVGSVEDVDRLPPRQHRHGRARAAGVVRGRDRAMGRPGGGGPRRQGPDARGPRLDPRRWRPLRGARAARR